MHENGAAIYLLNMMLFLKGLSKCKLLLMAGAVYHTKFIQPQEAKEVPLKGRPSFTRVYFQRFI